MTDTKKLSEQQVRDAVEKSRGLGMIVEPPISFTQLTESLNALFASQVAAPSPATEQKCPKCGNQMLEEVGHETGGPQGWMVDEIGGCPRCLEEIIADAQVREQHQDALVAKLKELRDRWQSEQWAGDSIGSAAMSVLKRNAKELDAIIKEAKRE